MENFIYGKNAVIEAILNIPERINKIYIQKGIGLDNRLQKIKELSKNYSIILNYADLNKFKKNFDEGINLQGVIASVSPIKYKDFEDFLTEKKGDGYKKIIILDNIQDPHNFGAIIRTAAAGGYDGIIIPNHRSCPVNSTVEKISSGAVNKVPIIKVNSLSGAIQKLKDNNWWIMALDAHTDDNYLDVDYKNMNFALVFGSEGDGISRTVMKMADYKVKLPTNFESLNVSCCCAVIVYETLRQINYT